ncbi:DUF488 family protein [Idiomarina ramblicola]|uniref:DUF488 domain-containing protein n=1 Tax=Idiomarina ramblicola TaxID=263724 RepID=A0A432YY76_9GAMM|nr:DUF488 domain-containing protein [Idiomarina ramblicola]RUO68349.1 hypothetical protein CWI78_09015 [Idiomarina ramblicola]
MEKPFCCTIGFTQTRAQEFFENLKINEVKKLIDVRINPTSQLSGFAKAKDLKFFLNEICDISYQHEPLLCPEKELLKEYRSDMLSWNQYEIRFLDLMSKRKIEEELSLDYFDSSCLLCSEKKPHNCHRRLVVEYLNSYWNNRLVVKHI